MQQNEAWEGYLRAGAAEWRALCPHDSEAITARVDAAIAKVRATGLAADIPADLDGKGTARLVRSIELA